MLEAVETGANGVGESVRAALRLELVRELLESREGDRAVEVRVQLRLGELLEELELRGREAREGLCSVSGNGVIGHFWSAYGLWIA